MVVKRKVKHNWLGMALVSLLAVSCTGNEVFFHYRPVDVGGWNKDSLCVFDIPVNDTASAYDMYVNVRNRSEYPYQNLWLFMQEMLPDSTIRTDSIELYLADQRGKWLGAGVGAVKEMPVLYRRNFHFHQKGTYHYRIGHGMRDSLLKGVNDIGMKVEKARDVK
ncbi:MAG TPA: gliding motility lipoprotein GldH [Paludibacter sp.]|nr:gliding motility lipoprotein GldH [Paludibacter sp.]